MMTNGHNIARILRNGYAAVTFTSPYDGYSAVEVGQDGMVRSTIPVADHDFALAMEVGGRAMNLLRPWSGGIVCAHGLVRRERSGDWQPATSCGCGQEPIDRNPERRS